MPEEVYSTFPEGIGDEEIFEMMILGSMRAICYNCNTENIIDPEKESFNCSKCNSSQISPLLNPTEYDERKKDVKDFSINY